MNVSALDNFKGQSKSYGRATAEVSGCLRGACRLDCSKQWSGKCWSLDNCPPPNQLVLEADAIGFLSGSVLVRYLFVTQLGGLLVSRVLGLVFCPFNY